MDHTEVEVRISKVRAILVGTVAFLVVTTFVAQLLKAHHFAADVTRFFDSDQKLNFPSLYKILMLTAVGLVAGLISAAAKQAGDPWARHWGRLGVLAALLGTDEATGTHESVSSFLHNHLHLSGALHFTWVIVYIPVGIVVALLFARFWWSLPDEPRRNLGIAVVLAGGGSAGLELAKGDVVAHGAGQALHYYLLAATSDSLEEIGLAALLLTLLLELSRRTARIDATVSAPSPRAALPAEST